jgi:glutamyl-tRNA synthetase
VHRLDDFIPYMSFFFGGSVEYVAVRDKLKPVAGKSGPETAELLDEYVQEIERDNTARSFTAPALEAFSREFCQRHAVKAKELFMLLRVAVTGRTASPSLFDTMAICGKDRCRTRIRDVVAYLRTLK